MKYFLLGLVSFLIFFGFSFGMGASSQTGEIGEATFAGGCFWCMEAAFQIQEGVTDVISGYSGGDEENPNYNEVSSGKTGHKEAVNVTYDSSKISYEKLLDIFWKSIDPTDIEGQFSDRGFQYKTAIFYHDETQKEAAEKSKQELEASNKFDKLIVTEILPFTNFYKAEEGHQDYFQKRTEQYQAYAEGSGRKGFLEETWGKISDGKEESWEKPSDEELKKILTEIQYKVTQKDGTEKPFDNEYWENHEEGIYVDIVSGEPLFSSKDKFDSGTGWPSFLKPIEDDVVVEKDDYKLLYRRTEIRSKIADSHVGHIILDGPVENDKVRYCMNSAALRFVPKEDLEKEGYEKYLEGFE